MNYTDNNDASIVESIPLNRLYLLDNLEDWKVQDEDTDVCGWALYAGDEKVGQVKNLIVNPRFKKVLYIGVELDERINKYRTPDYSVYFTDEFRSYYGKKDDRYIIVPIGMISIDEDSKRVNAARNLNSAHFANSPRFSQIEDGTIAPIHELLVVRYYTDYDDLYNNEYDDNRFDINTFRDDAYITDEGFYTSDLFSRRRYFDRYVDYNPSMIGFKTGMVKRRR